MDVPTKCFAGSCQFGVVVFKYLTGKFVSEVLQQRTRVNGQELQQGKLQLDLKKKIFSEKVLNIKMSFPEKL